MLFYIFEIVIVIVLGLSITCIISKDYKKVASLLWVTSFICLISASIFHTQVEVLTKAVSVQETLKDESIGLLSLDLDPVIIFDPIITPLPNPSPEPTPPPVTKEIAEKPPRYDFSDEDIYIMARLLCGSKYIDGDGEYDFDYGKDDQYEQISLVLCVIMNRVRDERFPDTIEDVIMQRYAGQSHQFAPVAKWKESKIEVSDIAIQRVTEWCNAYNQDPIVAQSIPENYIYFSSNGRGINIARPNL